jgi:hypothetical protein
MRVSPSAANRAIFGSPATALDVVQAAQPYVVEGAEFIGT